MFKSRNMILFFFITAGIFFSLEVTGNPGEVPSQDTSGLKPIVYPKPGKSSTKPYTNLAKDDLEPLKLNASRSNTPSVPQNFIRSINGKPYVSDADPNGFTDRSVCESPKSLTSGSKLRSTKLPHNPPPPLPPIRPLAQPSRLLNNIPPPNPHQQTNPPAPIISFGTEQTNKKLSEPSDTLKFDDILSKLRDPEDYNASEQLPWYNPNYIPTSVQPFSGDPPVFRISDKIMEETWFHREYFRRYPNQKFYLNLTAKRVAEQIIAYDFTGFQNEKNLKLLILYYLKNLLLLIGVNDIFQISELPAEYTPLFKETMRTHMGGHYENHQRLMRKYTIGLPAGNFVTFNGMELKKQDIVDKRTFIDVVDYPVLVAQGVIGMITITCQELTEINVVNPSSWPREIRNYFWDNNVKHHHYNTRVHQCPQTDETNYEIFVKTMRPTYSVVQDGDTIFYETSRTYKSVYYIEDRRSIRVAVPDIDRVQLNMLLLHDYPVFER